MFRLSPKWRGFACAVALGIGTSAAPAQVSLPDQLDLARLVDLSAQRLKTRITYDDQSLKGRVTLRQAGTISDDELWRLTNRLLAEQGFTTIRAGDDDTIAVVKIANAAQAARVERLEDLVADLYHGPAHNNLGVIYLKQGKLYEAAGEFEWSRKLLPGHPDPRVNLAITLERAGRSADAMHEYASALEVMPEHLPAIQGLTRLQLRTGTTDELTHSRLQTIAMRSESEKWRDWARVQMMRLER